MICQKLVFIYVVCLIYYVFFLKIKPLSVSTLAFTAFTFAFNFIITLLKAMTPSLSKLGTNS